MSAANFLPLTTYREFAPLEMANRARLFRDEMLRRRTVRQFSSRPVSHEVIEDCLSVACSSPSGADKQPWHFVVVSNAEVKSRIRAAAEEEERRFYSGRAPQEWLDALAPLGTDENKPYLETAPYLIVIFAEHYEVAPDGRKPKNYDVTESVGIATGMLISAVHVAGLVSLTHTPSPMGFLSEILGRPPQEKHFLVLVVGYPDGEAQVPDISKKSLQEAVTFL
jgi:nitroreductase